MMTSRYAIHKIQLNMDGGKRPIIHVAALGKDTAMELVEKNRMWFEMSGKKLLGWEYLNELDIANMSEEEYSLYLEDCEIVDEV